MNEKRIGELEQDIEDAYMILEHTSLSGEERNDIEDCIRGYKNEIVKCNYPDMVNSYHPSKSVDN